MSYDPHRDSGESYAELIALAEAGHDVPESRLLTAKHRDAVKEEHQSEAEQVAADLAAAREHAEHQREADLAAARPVVDDLAAEHAAALEDYWPAAAAARDAIEERSRKWSAVTAAHRELREYVVEHFGTDPQAPVNAHPYKAVVIDGQVIRTDRVEPQEES